jgi:Na+-transporting NADH:ubiquinone oxidoreductase subunit C
MSKGDSAGKTIAVAGVLCIVCSIAVSMAAVTLRPTQQMNQALDKKKNILLAGGLYEEGDDIEQIFANQVEAKLIDIATGEESDAFDPQTYDAKKALKDPELRVEIPAELDLGKIKRRPKYAVVYEARKNGALDQVIIPVYGKGLWSTLYGYLAIKADGNTVSGLGFYAHAETPGLGGEVDNPKWKAQWGGKKLYDEDWNLQIEVLKGKVDKDRAESIHQIDGLSGATITTRGVTDLIRYWLGDHGLGSYVASLRQSGGA